MKTIKVRRTRHAGHCWRIKDELISDVLLSTPSHGRAKAGCPARTYIQQLCTDMGCCPEDLPEAMGEKGSGISVLMAWHDDDDDVKTNPDKQQQIINVAHIYIYIYIYICLFIFSYNVWKHVRYSVLVSRQPVSVAQGGTALLMMMLKQTLISSNKIANVAYVVIETKRSII